MIVESYSLVLDGGEEEVTCGLGNAILVVDITNWRELFLAESTVQYILVCLVASR